MYPMKVLDKNSRKPCNSKNDNLAINEKNLGYDFETHQTKQNIMIF